MDIYTLNENFLDDAVVDEYVSAIWTERYSKAGDVQIVVPATLENIAKLAEGTFLGLRGSKEVMLLETQSMENGLMTVVGKTLPIFLNQRFGWFKHPTDSTVENRIAEYVDEAAKPGEFIADVVNKMVINTVPFTDSWVPANLDWEAEEIPFLSLGAVDTSGTDQRLTLPIGPLYDSIEQLAEQHGVGISLYLESADPDTGYILKFTTYKGKDRTGDQSTYPLVRLSPQLDSLSDLKEVRSNALYKNVVYVYYQGTITTHYAEPDLPIPEGFNRRVLIRDAEGAPVGTGTYNSGSRYGGSWTQTYVTPADITKFREQIAKDAFANANYIRAIDGQTSPGDDYIYGVDYGLGDVIELEGLTGTIAKARITEYIRSEDRNGEKNYPTISVLEEG